MPQTATPTTVPTWKWSPTNRVWFTHFPSPTPHVNRVTMKLRKFDEPVYNQRHESSTFYHLTVELDGEVVYLIDYKTHATFFGTYAGYLAKNLPSGGEPDACRHCLARTISDLMGDIGDLLGEIQPDLPNDDFSLRLSKNTMTRMLQDMTKMEIEGRP